MTDKKIQDLQDRVALKELVDTFSILADKKDIPNQVLLFTENGIVASKVNGQDGPALVGRKQIGDAFAAFLANFQVVYHMNGQQVVTIDGDKATGTSYCMVTMTSTRDGKRMRTAMGVFYNDEYVREKGKWLIAKRTSNFAWQDVQPMGQ